MTGDIVKNIPSGIITFLFTDIECSTVLAQKFPETYLKALLRHRNILSKVIEKYNGFVFEIIGDAFCASFSSAFDGIRAACEIQKCLRDEIKIEPKINVRIGLHCGEAIWEDNRYSGYLDLARTQRVMSVAYGGQILISGSVKNELTIPYNDFSLKYLGERRLKDLFNPEHIYQIIYDELPSEFPPLKTLDARPNNLPIQLSSFIGREEEIKDIKDLIRKNRLVTLTGTGGNGKTRLSIHAGAEMIDEFPNGVWLVELASLHDGKLIYESLSSVFEINIKPDQKSEETLIKFLREKDILIIIDNCEHLIEYVATLVLKILSSTRKVKILATSRESLQIPGETVYKVKSLSLPDLKEKLTAQSVMQYESVKLFRERALANRKDFKITDENAEVIAKLCKEIDGIPLAIELAAARIKVLSVEKILEKISDMFNLLTGGNRTALPKHQTLRALIDWSFNLLSDKEKLLFAKLGYFEGGFSIDAVEFICQDENTSYFELIELLTNLSDKSLIKIDDCKGKQRYSMLATIKLYAKQLAETDFILDETYYKHLLFYLKLITESEAGLRSNLQKQWLDKLEAEIENIRLALNYSQNNYPEISLKMTVALGVFWSTKGFFSEGLDRINLLLAKHDFKDENLVANAYLWRGFVLMHKGLYKDSSEAFQKCIELSENSGNDSLLANSLSYLGILKLYEGDFASAKNIQEKCLSIRKKNNDKLGIAGSLNSLGLFSYKQKDYESALNYLFESLELYRELKDVRSIAANLGNIGKIYTSMGNYDKSFNSLFECFKLSAELGDKYVMAHCIEALGIVFLRKGKLEQSCRLLAFSKQIFEDIGVELSGDELLAFDNAIPELRTLLGNDVFEEIWNEEINLESKDAIAFVFETVKDFQ